MKTSYFLLFLLFVIIPGLHASYPAGVVEEMPAIAIAPVPVIEEAAPAPEVEAEVVAPAAVLAPEEYVLPAPVVAPTPIVAPAPLVASVPVMTPTPIVASSPLFANAMYSHHHHPRTEVHNTAQSYTKETGHTTDTSMAFDAHHFPSAFGYFPRQFYDDLLVAAPWRARLHLKKMAAEKAAKARKLFDKNRN
ncbi:hypothetical protein Aduo_017236 [Ancylostoma duodenale]